VEPEDRLVARELERRWEGALHEQRALEEEYDRFLARQPRELSAEDRRCLEAAAADVPALWRASSTTARERQTIIRFLVERITVAIRGESERVDVTIRWAGGRESRHEIRRPVLKYEQLSNYEALRDRVVELHRAGRSTREIAEQLNREGFYPPRDPGQFNRVVINQLLKRQGLSWEGIGSRTLAPEGLGSHEWRLTALARELEIPEITLRSWCYRGWVSGRQSATVRGLWILWADDAELTRLRGLRDWGRGNSGRARPRELTTPGAPSRAKETPSCRQATPLTPRDVPRGEKEE
jgi:hypothetical protein